MLSLVEGHISVLWALWENLFDVKQTQVRFQHPVSGSVMPDSSFCEILFGYDQGGCKERVAVLTI